MISEDPFLCVITPIFDGAVGALELLIKALKRQTMQDFIHVMISAGPSDIASRLIKSLNDPRFIYEEHAELETKDIEELIASLGKRRTYCFKNYRAQRYVCLDADLQIKSDDYFLQLYKHHKDADILITKVWVWPPKKNGPATVFPKHPLARGRLDLSNFSFSRNVATHPECIYPTDMGFFGGRDGDWRFFERLILFASQTDHQKPGSGTYKIIPIVSAVYNGNSNYTSVSKLSTD